MKLTVRRSDLRTALGTVKPAVMKGGKPALAGVLVDVADDGSARLTCTNIDSTITTSLAATQLDGEAGRVLVYHEPLDNLSRNTASDTVELATTDDGLLHVTAGRAKARLCTLDASSFPQPQPIHKATEVKLDGDWQALQRVLAFKSEDTTRPVLTGVHVNGPAGVVETTDSFRLARHTVDVDADLLLSPAPVAAAARACPDGPVTLRWSTSDSGGGRYEVEGDGTVWSGSILDGKFPPVDSLIPVNPPLSLTVDRDELLAAIRTVASIGDEAQIGKDGKTTHATNVRLRQDEATGEVVVSRAARDVGDAEVVLPAEVTGDCAYAFKAQFLVQLLAALTDDTVTLQGVDALKPWVAREGGFLGLQMPVKV